MGTDPKMKVSFVIPFSKLATVCGAMEGEMEDFSAVQLGAGHVSAPTRHSPQHYAMGHSKTNRSVSAVILDALKLAPNRRLHRDVLKKLVKEDGWSENSVTPSVSDLIKAKAVKRDPDGIVTML